MTGGKVVAIIDGKPDSGSLLVIQQVVRETGDSWLMLNRTNYADCSLLMQVMLEVRKLWIAINDGMPKRETDHTSMECLLRSIPLEMLSTLAIKVTSKEAWETVKTMRLGVTQMRDSKAPVLKKQLEAIKFNDDEDIDDFGMCLSSLVSQFGVLGVKISEPDVIRKFLSVVLKKFSHMACSIETLVDLDTLSLEEHIGQLKAAEERYELEEPEVKPAGKLLLYEQEWFARMKLRDDGVSSSQAEHGSSKPRGCRHGRGNPGVQGGTENYDTSRD
jgi:hypothetical protein